MIGILLLVLALVTAIGGSYVWVRRQGAPPSEGVPPAAVTRPPPRVPLLMEAIGYVGAILIAAGGAAAVAERWGDLTGWAHVGVFGSAAAALVLAGVPLRRMRDPAVQRLVGVLWFMSTALAAGVAGFASAEVLDRSESVTCLAVGATASAWAAVLWLVRPRASQVVALFGALVVTTVGAVLVIVGTDDPGLPLAAALWALGAAWAVLGWRRIAVPIWLSLPLGILLALLAPTVAIGEHGWLHVVGVVCAAAVMAAGVRLRNIALLAMGAVAMFGYVTSLVVRYFGDTFGVPAALAATGAVIIALTVVSGRLLPIVRAQRPPRHVEGRPATGRR
jgi:hypothetical protein